MSLSARDVIAHFDELRVRGVALAPVLSVPLGVWDFLSAAEDGDGWPQRLKYRLARSRLVGELRRYRQRRDRDDAVPAPARYVLLATGRRRVGAISRPILDRLPAGSHLTVYTNRQVDVDDGTERALRHDALPTEAAEERRERRRLWPALTRRVRALEGCEGLSPSLLEKILSTLSVAVADVLRAERLLEATRPAVVVTEYDRRPFESVVCQVARQRGIPTVTLVHGLQLADDPMWTPLLTDYAIVWGEGMRDFYVREGTPPERLLVGGYPRLHPPGDGLYGNDAERRRSGSSAGRPVVLFLSSDIGRDKPLAELVAELHARLPAPQYRIRPHPQEDLAHYDAHVARGCCTLDDPGTTPIESSLHDADVVVGMASTACFDALLLGKPVVLIPDARRPYGRIPALGEAVERGAAAVAGDEADLCRLLEAWGDGAPAWHERVRAYAARHAASLGDAAAEASATLIEQIADGAVPGPVAVPEAARHASAPHRPE